MSQPSTCQPRSKGASSEGHDTCAIPSQLDYVSARGGPVGDHLVYEHSGQQLPGDEAGDRQRNQPDGVDNKKETVKALKTRHRGTKTH